jgi:hypothetical protein
MWEHLSLVAAQVGLAELAGQARQARQVSRRQQQQGDDGQHQLLERFSCPCLGDALVRGMAILADRGFRTDGRTGQRSHVVQARISCKGRLSQSTSIWVDVQSEIGDRKMSSRGSCNYQ